MNTPELVICLFLFIGFQVKAFQFDSYKKWIQDSSLGIDGVNYEGVGSRQESVIFAAHNQDWEYVRSFMENGFELNTADPEGRTLAILAAESGQWDMVHWLGDKGADINLQDGLQRSLLHVASLHHRWDDMKILVANGSNINAVDCLGRTPTIMAASYKAWDIVQWLIEHGADINARDRFRRSVVLLAALHKNWKFVKWLLSKGADPKVTDLNTKTLLHLAAIANNLEVVQILVEDFGVDFNQEDRGGNTPINLAAISSDPKGSVYNYLIYMREIKTQTSTYRRGNTEYKISELSLLNRVNKMFEIMSIGESSFNIKMYGRVILVLGNLKSGKSTLIKYLTLSTSELTSQPVVEGSGLFKIVPINGTAVPTSVYPQFVKYKEKGVVFCDGPRFSNMGTISQDLTAMHFLKKVTEKFKRVKLVFTVSHLTVKRGMNAEGFIAFLQHCITFITNFKHFSKSSCIVVTKFEGPRSDVPDSQLERAAAISISKAAEAMVEELSKKDLPAEKKIFYKRAVDFLLIFLNKNKRGEYDRIKIFRRPTSAGSLNKMRRMNWSKTRLSNYIFDKLSYVKVKRSHFDYPISDTTLKTIYKFEQATNKEITCVMNDIANHVEDQLFSRARNSEDVFKIQHWFREGCKRIEEIMKLISDKNDPSSMLINIRLALEHVEIYPRRISTFKIEHLSDFLEFLQKIMKYKLKTTPWEWRDPFRMLLISIRQTRDWYDFLAFLYQRLLAHDFQENREKFGNIESWGIKTASVAESLVVDENNIEMFLKIMARYNIRRIEAIELRHFHDFEIENLNKILKFTIVDKPVINCKNYYFTGSYISLKSFFEKCKNLRGDKLTIFATKKIFIDTNLNKFENVVLIAPTWEIVGKIEFNVSVTGCFRGIGKNFINIEKLTIIAKGSGRPQPHSGGKVVLYELGRCAVSLPQDINNYRFYSVEHLKNTFVSSTILEFLSGIDGSPQILQHYSTEILLKELIGLEEKYNDLKETTDFLPFYESLLKRTEMYSNNLVGKEQALPYKITLKHLFTVIMSKVSSLRQSRRDHLVLNIAEFFRLSTYIIEQVKEKGNKIATTQFKNKLQIDLERKIDEGQKMVKTQVRKAVSEIIHDVNKSINKLLEAVQKKTKEKESEKQKLESQKAKLKENLRKQLTEIEKKDIFPFVGYSIDTLFSFQSYGFSDILQGKTPLPKTIPQTIFDVAQQALQIPRGLLEDVLTTATSFCEKFILNPKNLIDTISDAIEKITSSGAVDTVMDKVKTFGKQLFNGVGNFFKGIFRGRRSIHSYKRSLFVKLDHKVKVNLSIPEFSFERRALFKKFYTDETEKGIEDIDRQIKSVEQDIRQQIEIQHEIYSQLYPMLKSVEDTMSKFTNKLGTGSSLELSMSGFEVHTALRNAQRAMSHVSRGNEEVQSEMKIHMDNLRAAVDVQVSTFQKLQDYMEQFKMTQNLHELANPDYFKQEYPKEIENDINKLDLMISSNTLLSHRARALGALKQWVFPFAHDYLGMFQIPEQLNYKRDVKDLVKCAKEELEKIQMTILTDAAIPTKRDRCTLNNYFYYDSPKGPYYIWKNNENTDFIVSLLSGEEVTANVDIRQKLNFNAVKFRYIKLSFRAINERKQQELNKLLRNFEIKMTHLGNSHFHCDGKIYTMTSDSLEIRYSLLEYSPGEHATVNEIFNKLRKGDMMLSPYATWKFRILDSANKGILGKLLSFIGDIDVIFEGEGQYLNEDCISQCNNNMDDYYKVDGIV